MSSFKDFTEPSNFLAAFFIVVAVDPAFFQQQPASLRKRCILDLGNKRFAGGLWSKIQAGLLIFEPLPYKRQAPNMLLGLFFANREAPLRFYNEPLFGA